MRTGEALAAARMLRATWWLLVGVALAWLWLVPAAHAETIAATVGPGTVAPVSYSCYSGTPPADKRTNQAAAEDWCFAYAFGDSLLPLYVRDYRESRSYGYMLNWKRADGTVANKGVGMTYTCAAGGTKVYAATGDQLCTTSTSYSCPATGGWTLSGTSCTRPDCPAGQTHNATTGVCEVDCAAKAGQTPPTNASNGVPGALGWKNPSAAPGSATGTSACYGGCKVTGQKTRCVNSTDSSLYNCAIMGAEYTGAACSAGDDAIPAGAAVPSDGAKDKSAYDCVAGGMSAGTVNGTVVCYEAGKTSESSTKTKTTTPGSGTGGSTETTTTKRECEGDKCTTTTSTSTTTGGTGPGGTGSGSTTTPGATEKTQESEDDYCAEHPHEKACESTEAGAPAGVDGLYTKGSRTVAQAFGDFKTQVQAAPFYSAATGYFTAGGIPGGSCGGLSTDVGVMGSSWHVDADAIFCGSMAASFYTVLGLGVMLAAGWVAFKIAVL